MNSIDKIKKSMLHYHQFELTSNRNKNMSDNEMIAQFMGLQKVPCNIGTEDGHFTEGYEHPRVNVPIIPSGMKYKYSWDWLMPVVCRIDDLFGDDDYIDDQINKVHNAVLKFNREIVHRAVVEFIKSQKL